MSTMKFLHVDGTECTNPVQVGNDTREQCGDRHPSEWVFPERSLLTKADTETLRKIILALEAFPYSGDAALGLGSKDRALPWILDMLERLDVQVREGIAERDGAIGEAADLRKLIRGVGEFLNKAQELGGKKRP